MHESLIYFASTSFRASVTLLYSCAFVVAKPYIEVIMWLEEISSQRMLSNVFSFSALTFLSINSASFSFLKLLHSSFMAQIIYN